MCSPSLEQALELAGRVGSSTGTSTAVTSSLKADMAPRPRPGAVRHGWAGLRSGGKTIGKPWENHGKPHIKMI